MCNQIQRILRGGRKSALETITKETTITTQTCGSTEIISVKQLREKSSDACQFFHVHVGM